MCLVIEMTEYKSCPQHEEGNAHNGHAGIFTKDLAKAQKAAAELEFSGVMINDSSDYRFDAMPFGGYKYGGLGREGVKFAMQEMSQTKVICFAH